MNEDGGLIFILGFVLGVMVIGLIWATMDRRIQGEWRWEAVQHGCAAYDSRTGEWGWIGGDAE